MKIKILILLLVIVSLLQSVNSDIEVECYDTIICDDVFPNFYSDWDDRYFDSDPVLYCPSLERSNFNVEEVFTIGIADIIDCNDANDSNTFYRGYFYANEYDSENNLYFVSPRFSLNLYDDSLDCDSFAYFIYVRGIIHDLNSDFSDPISVEYENYYGDSCPVDSYTVTPYFNAINLFDDDDLVVYNPLPKDISSYREEPFAAVSSLIYTEYFLQNQSADRDNQLDYAQDICPDLTFEDDLCDFELADDKIEDVLTNETKVDVNNLHTFGSGVYVETNMTHALKYHFENTKVPIHIKTSITWTYYERNDLGIDVEKNFGGSRYTFVILGMQYNSPGNYSYLIQYPSGYKFIWSEETLQERWSLLHYGGHYFTTQVNQDWKYEIREPDNETVVYFDDSEYRILYNSSYKICLNFDDSNNYYETTDPLARVYIDGSWSDYQDMSENECFSDDLIIFDDEIYLGQTQIQTKSKGGTDSDTVYYSANTPTVSNPTYEPILYYNDTELTLYYTSDVGYTTGCSLESQTGDYVYLEELDLNYNINHECTFNLYSGGEPLFIGGQEIQTSTFGENYYYSYNTSFVNPKYMHYPLNFSPNVPFECYIDSPCTIFDNQDLTDLGSYEDNPTGTYTLYDQILEYYSIELITGSEYQLFNYVDVSPKERDTYNFNFNYEFVFTELGTETIELCVKTNQEPVKCKQYDIIVNENFLGGGGGSGGGSQDQNSSFGCEFTVDFDESILGSCPGYMYRFFWVDVDRDEEWSAIPLDPPVDYTPDPDCMNESCYIDIDMSDKYDDNYCEGYELVVDTSSETERADIFVCYDISLWGEGPCFIGDISYSFWTELLGFSLGGCFGETVIVDYDMVFEDIYDYINRLYELCDDYHIPNNDSGYFCMLSSTEVLRCEYDCSVHDTDGDGVNDCNDICCGGDDTIDTDGDGVPDYCDPDEEDPTIPFDPDDPDDPDDPSEPGDGEDGYYQGIYSLLCNNGVLDTDIGETEIDYGGVCGTCDDGELSNLIGETDIDYGGKCGFCLPNVSKSDDVPYNLISNFTYPFNESLCDEGYGVMYGFVSIITVIIILILIILVLVLLVIAFFYIYSFYRSYKFLRVITKKTKEIIEKYK